MLGVIVRPPLLPAPVERGRGARRRIEPATASAIGAARVGVAIGVGGDGRGRRHPRADVEVPGHHDEPDQLAERHRADRLHRRRDRPPGTGSSACIIRSVSVGVPHVRLQPGEQRRRRAAPAASPRRTHPSRSRLHGRNRRPPGRHEFASVASDAVVGGAQVGRRGTGPGRSGPPSPGRSRRRRATGRRSPRGRGSGGSARARGPTTVAATRPNVPSPASTLPTSCSRAPAISARRRRGAAGEEAAGDLDRRGAGRRSTCAATAPPPRRSSQRRAHASSAADGGRDDSEVTNRRTR